MGRPAAVICFTAFIVGMPAVDLSAQVMGGPMSESLSFTEGLLPRDGVYLTPEGNVVVIRRGDGPTRYRLADFRRAA